MQDIITWANDQLLRMQWLSDLVTWMLRDGFGMDMAGRAADSVHFWIYAVIKIFILLPALIFAISYIQSFSRPNGHAGSLGRVRGSGPTRWPPFWAR